MEHPRFSLVLPVFDPPVETLAATIESISVQTFGDLECLMVDDASTDPAVRAELERRAAADSRLRLVRRDHNGGIAAATNDGLDAADGDVVVFCDHDDLLAPTALERIAEHLRLHPDDDVVYTDERLIDDDGELVFEYRKPAWSPQRMLGHNYFNHLVAVRRSLIGDTRVRSEFEPAQDWDFLLRILPDARGVGHLPEMLYSWRAIRGSTALDASEKPEVFAAVRRTAQAALDRLDEAATATIATTADGSPVTAVRIDRRRDPAVTVATVAITPRSTPDAVAAEIEATGADVVVLLDESAPAPSSDSLDVLAAEATRPVVGAAGPLLADTDGRLVSAGRALWPTLCDPHRGEPVDNDGPWGAFRVAREVSALSPHGFAISRSRFVGAGGLSPDVSLDVAIAELCVRLRSAGTPAVWTPVARLVSEWPPLDPYRTERELAEIARRRPEIDDEPFAVDGRGAAATLGASPDRRVARSIALGVVDVVTCDVFDTLVTRPAATPSDVFVLLADELHRRGWLHPTVSRQLFAGGRRRAERRARNDVRERREDAPAPECTIEEIYDRLPHQWFAEHVDPADLIAAELDAEAATLRPIEPAVAALRRAHDAGLRTVLVSDVYLSADRLTSLLERVGIDRSTIDRVVTSADHRLGKADGLLEQVIAAETSRPGRVVHLGDNQVSDVDTATALGAVAVPTDLTDGIRHVDTAPAELLRYSTSRGGDGGITAAVRAAVMSSEAGGDPAFQFGAAVAGPAVAGFARWAAATAAELGAERIHCLYREGARIAELIEQLAPGTVRPAGVHASRWVVARAAVLSGDADEIAVALARRRHFDLDHVVEAFGCDRARLTEVLGPGPFDVHATVRAYEAIAADPVLRDQLTAHTAALRHRLLRYLDRAIGLDGDGPIVVCDIGWGGTIQEGLTTVLRSAGIDRPVIGLYLALSEPGEDRLAGGADMRAYLPHRYLDGAGSRHSRVVSHNADIAERLLTPRMGTLVDIDAEGEPVCLPAGHDHIPPSLLAAQSGVQAFCDALAAVGRSAPWADDRVWVDDVAFRSALAARFAAGILVPSASVAAALSTWPHDDVAGTHARAIVPEHLTELARYVGVSSLDRIAWTETAWPEGVAAMVNPPLSAQIGAVAAGSDPRALAATSDTGVARLAVFEQGTDLATAQDARVPDLSPAGWAVLRVDTPVGSVRSLRFDPGDASALCDVGGWTIRFELDDGSTVDRAIDDLGTDDLVWVDAHPIDARRLGIRPGGHVLVAVDDEFGARVRRVVTDVAFRTWTVDASSPLVSTPWRQRLVDGQRRAVRAARRLQARRRSGR